ncbi:MAG: hypothetical protein IJ325_06850 [Clostridia bacterium]|nr:hypothetical protein [Clostridia bacterium]
MILDYTNGERHCLGYSASQKYALNGNYLNYAVLRWGEYLCVISEYDDPSVGDPGERLQCSYNSETYQFESREGWETMVCMIPYQPDASQRVRLESKTGVQNTFQASGSSAAYFLQYFSNCDIPPYISFTPELYADHVNTLTVTQSELDEGHFGAVNKLTLYMRAPGETEFTGTVLLSASRETECTCTLGDVLGYEWYMVLQYCTYDEAEWSNSYSQYVSITQIETPVQTIGQSASRPTAPSALSAGMLLAGSKVNISWEAVQSDLVPVVSYTLERSVNGTDFITLYTGTALQYPDTVPAGANSVWYRLRTNGENGASSSWYTTDALSVVKSNIYIGTADGIRLVSAVHIGSHTASPLAIVG